MNHLAVNQVAAFVPCRAGSQRVPNKNTRPFTPDGRSLLDLKLSQLLDTKLVSSIVVSSNDLEVIEKADQILGNGQVSYRIDKRPDHLCTNTTSTDDLIRYVPNIIEEEHVLWTHVTSPFVVGHHYDAAITSYFQALQSTHYDSIASATLRQTFLWSAAGPINYDRAKERWPRTQTLNQVWELNSAFFIAPLTTYQNQSDRIGYKPRFFELDDLTALEIDRQDQFDLAASLWSALDK